MKATICFGRFDGIHNGHSVLLRKLASTKGDKYLWISPSNKTNLMPWIKRHGFLHNFCVANGIIIVQEFFKTPYEIAEELVSLGYRDIEIICGGDRHESYLKLGDYLGKFNAKTLLNVTPREEAHASATKVRKSVETRNREEYNNLTDFSVLNEEQKADQYVLLQRYLKMQDSLD